MSGMTRCLAGSLAVLLAACGGGGGSSTQPPPPPPAAPTVTYAAPPVFTVGTAITAVTPAVTGSPTSFSISPALPAGLSINVTTGVISGTPTTPVAQANYQATASNSGGSGNATISLTVKAVVPSIDFAQTTYIFTTGAAANVAPSSTGGTVVSWSIDRALPAGLAISATTGAITGTPTAVAASSAYVITATNSGGSDTFNLDIAVANGVLLELGNSGGVQRVIYDGTRVASLDNFFHAVLWNAQDSAILATQDSVRCVEDCGGNVALAGNSMVTRNQTGFTVRASTSGALVSTIAFTATRGTWWRVATDGSYVVSGDPNGLSVWSRAGVLLFARPGNYEQAKAFAAPGTLALAKGPAGAAVIENISVPGNVTTLSSAFNGTFQNWFADGERFLTNVSNTIFVYSKIAAQIDIAALSTINELGGNGNFFWVRLPNQTLNVYAVGSGGATVTPFTLSTATVVIPSGSTLGLIDGANIGVVNLAVATPVRTNYTAPSAIVPLNANLRVYAALSSTDWVFGNSDGVMLGELNGGGAPQLYARGTALSIAGSSAYSAVATADGIIHFFDATTHALAGTIAFPASKIALSSNGSVLAAMARAGNDRTLRFYSLPSGNLVSQIPYTYGVAGQPYLTDFSLSGAGNAVSLNLTIYGGFNQYARELRDASGTLIWSEPAAALSNLPLLLSPDATLVGATPGGRSPDIGTNIITSGVLTTAVQGVGVGWIDNTRLLVNRFLPGVINNPTIRFNGTEIVNASGTVVTRPTLPEIAVLQPVSANTIYSPELNEILDLTTGNTLWSSATDNMDQGAVAGNDVVFASRGPATVRIEPR